MRFLQNKPILKKNGKVSGSKFFCPLKRSRDRENHISQMAMQTDKHTGQDRLSTISLSVAMSIVGPRPPPPQNGEDVEKILQSHPLFMTSLPDNIDEDATLAALQSLVHDGSPDGR